MTKSPYCLSKSLPAKPENKYHFKKVIKDVPNCWYTAKSNNIRTTPKTFEALKDNTMNRN